MEMKNNAMKRRFRMISIFSVLLLACAGPLTIQAEDSPNLPPPVKATVDFTRDVEPILHTKCYVCHGSEQQMNGLRLDQKEAALKGGYSGPAMIPGKSAESKLILKVASSKEGYKMPPAGPALSATEIGILRAWIDQGVQWPAPSAATQKLSLSERRSHWAFQPVRRPEVPMVRQRSWVRNPIDTFILSKLESEGIASSPEADKLTLIRRLCLDLTGLPPTPQEVNDFLSDNRRGLRAPG